MHIFQQIPIGSHTGILVFNGLVKEHPTINFEYEESEQITLGAMKNDQKYIAMELGREKHMKKAIGFAQGCWTCTPVHIDKTKGITDI